MAKSEHSAEPQRTPFTLLAVTALAVSNLMVGILQGNTLLILASSALSAGFAYVYAGRSGMIPGRGGALRETPPPEPDAESGAAIVAKRRFPLWLFLAVIFVMMPAILLFLQTIEQ